MTDQPDDWLAAERERHGCATVLGTRAGSSARVLSRRRPGHEGVDDRVDVLAGIQTDTGLVGAKRFQGVKLRLQQRGGHEMAGPGGQPGGDEFRRSAEAQEFDTRAVRPKLVAVLALERRTTRYAAVA